MQGRTYANMFGLVERFIGAKMIEVGRDHALGDQIAFEAVVRFTDEELKHQELFRRVELLVGAGMPAGYRFDVAGQRRRLRSCSARAPGRCSALTCHIELFSQAHYRASIAARDDLSPLFKDIFLFHWKEESQHAIIDELEWIREDAKLASPEARDAAVDDLIELVGGVDGILQGQAAADTAYFLRVVGMAGDEKRAAAVGATLLKAYRWQYIVSGAIHPHFQKVLASLVNDEQMARIQAALGPLTYAMPARAEAAAAMTH